MDDAAGLAHQRLDRGPVQDIALPVLGLAPAAGRRVERPAGHAQDAVHPVLLFQRADHRRADLPGRSGDGDSERHGQLPPQSLSWADTLGPIMHAVIGAVTPGSVGADGLQRGAMSLLSARPGDRPAILRSQARTSLGGPMKVLYTAEATAYGGREGRVRSSDGALVADLAIPKELGGPGGPATNPEQLFAAGYAACCENAIRLTARRMKLAANGASVTARVGIGPDGSGGYGLAVELHARLPELDRDQAEQVVAKAHTVCPYSNAVRGNVEVTVVVDPAPHVI